MSQSNPTRPEATRYAESYILYGDQSKAWRAAFPQSKANPKVVNEKASCFHKIEKVQERIQELQKISKIQSEEEFGLSVGELKKMLATAAARGLAHKDRDWET